MHAILMLHDIRSAHNVGSLFRTADAAGIEKIYLSNTTATPIDRFGRARSDIAKVALGAEKAIAWEVYSDALPILKKYASQGYTTIAVEQSEHSTDYKHVHAKGDILFVLGNEVEGLPESILSQVNTIAEIPMHGRKESLNVAVAGGIALFRVLDR